MRRRKWLDCDLWFGGSGGWFECVGVVADEAFSQMVYVSIIFGLEG